MVTLDKPVCSVQAYCFHFTLYHIISIVNHCFGCHFLRIKYFIIKKNKNERTKSFFSIFQIFI